LVAMILIVINTMSHEQNGLNHSRDGSHRQLEAARSVGVHTLHQDTASGENMP
jgi:hypothetical protein